MFEVCTQYLTVLGLLFTLLIACDQCADVRLGDDGTVFTSPDGIALVDVTRVSLLTPLSGGQRVTFYSSGTNHSTEKIIVAADFYTISVKRVTVRDEGEYHSQMTHNPFGSTRSVSASTTITAYGMYKCAISI